MFGGKPLTCVGHFSFTHPHVFLIFIHFPLSLEKLPFIAHTLGLSGLYLGPTTERQHQGYRRMEVGGRGMCSASSRPLAVSWQVAASWPQLLPTSAACPVLPQLPFFAPKSLGSCFPYLQLPTFPSSFPLACSALS